MKVLTHLLNLYSSRFEQFSEVIDAISAEVVKVRIKLMVSRKNDQMSKLDEMLATLVSQQDSIGEEAEREKQRQKEEEKKGRGKPRRAGKGEIMVDESYKVLPSKDFKDVEIVPGERELSSKERLIRQMPKQGDLQTSHNYLDILFRLLHEDAIHDLRNGVVFMRDISKQQLSRKEIRQEIRHQTAVKLYDQITIQNVDVIDGARCIQFRLMMDKKIFVDWRISKKLLPGSLVILSHDSFKTLFIGTLKNTDSKQRNDTHKKFGYIAVNIEILKSTADNLDSYQDFQVLHEKSVFQMIESPAYFESYRHVLKQLQEMDTWPRLPMEKYLVHGKSLNFNQPQYLRHILHDNLNEVLSFIKDMNLDQSQHKAVKHALENDLVLIQGPPGTGKTYIGVQIVKLLLNYEQYWQPEGPILVVCYTNHALHQFIHYVKQFTNKIVKIGGKKDENLEQFNFFEKLKAVNKGPAFGKIYGNIRDSERAIKFYQREMMIYEYKIINSLINCYECQDVDAIIRQIRKHFSIYLNQSIKELKINQKDLIVAIEENFDKLRDNTQWNILVLFWLGVIDVKKLILKMKFDEDFKIHAKHLYNQQQQLQRQLSQSEQNYEYLAGEIAATQSELDQNLYAYNQEQTRKNGKYGQRLKKRIDEDTIKLEQLNEKIYQEEIQIENLQNEINYVRGEIQRMKREIEAAQKGLVIQQDQIDNDDIIEQDQRELDYENRKFLHDNKLDSLLDLLGSIFNPEITHDYFNGCQSIQDCIQAAREEVFEKEEHFTQSLEAIKSSQNVFDWNHINLKQRWAINNFAISASVKKQVDKIELAIKNYKQSWKEKQELEAYHAGPLLKQQHIVAMTTTGRAKNAQLLANVTFPILIVEEAAEVFEAHIMASLSDQTKHVILIGDHEQLRPSPAVHELDIQYNLSMSMFERLIKNEVKHSTLGIQRRMRPEISKIMNYIYPELSDHKNVLAYPKVRGISKNVYFFNHEWKEESNDFMMSKANHKEAQMVVRFAWYLLQQKQYNQQNITILTLYSGQLLTIKNLIKQNASYKDQMRQIRVVNVDNYQGEENEIIILSLVRSNNSGQIGFLKISNRVCVALSRAKHGLFIFGNSQCLIGSKKLELWEQVIQYMKDNLFFGNYLPLKCENHSDITEVKTIDDFNQVPEGGCKKICNYRLECGHSCIKICHPFERTVQDPTGHNHVKCEKQCERPLICGHKCLRKCKECKNGNQPCKEKIEKVMLLCRHKIMILCSQKNDPKIKCNEECEKILPCGHPCKKYCGEKCTDFPCKIQVKKTLPCGHELDIDCSKDPNREICPKTCSQILPCGHPCPSKCNDCTSNGFHGRCKKDCNRILVCGHECKFPCSKNCPPCDKLCKTSCSHSKCSQKCGIVCNLCKEPCENNCKHSECTKLCSEPCNRQPCSLPCDKILSCEHPCLGLCGETCPQVCRICNKKHEAFQILFGNEQNEGARFIQLDCNHVFEMRALDMWMMDKKDAQTVRYKECPKCKAPIMKCKRYMNQINQTLNDINAIKAKILQKEKLYEAQLQNIENDFKDLKTNLSKFDVNSLNSLFKICLKIYEKVKLKFDQVRDLRDTDQINEVVKMHRCVIQLFTLAKIDLYHKYSLTMPERETSRLMFLDAEKDLFMNENFRKRCAAFVDPMFKRFKMEDELAHIIEAVGLDRGHWNKCPNGHYYVIADCGGAMEESKCPDCKMVIGGGNHILAAGNQFAKELGGANQWDPRGFNARFMSGQIDPRRYQ